MQSLVLALHTCRPQTCRHRLRRRHRHQVHIDKEGILFPDGKQAKKTTAWPSKPPTRPMDEPRAQRQTQGPTNPSHRLVTDVSRNEAIEHQEHQDHLLKHDSMGCKTSTTKYLKFQSIATHEPRHNIKSTSSRSDSDEPATTKSRATLSQEHPIRKA